MQVTVDVYLFIPGLSEENISGFGDESSSNRCEFLAFQNALVGSPSEYENRYLFRTRFLRPSSPTKHRRPALPAVIHGSRSAHQSVLGHVRKTLASTCGGRVFARKSFAT